MSGDEYQPVSGREGGAAAILLVVVFGSLLVLACRGLLHPATIEDLLWLGGAR